MVHAIHSAFWSTGNGLPIAIIPTQSKTICQHKLHDRAGIDIRILLFADLKKMNG